MWRDFRNLSKEVTPTLVVEKPVQKCRDNFMAGRGENMRRLPEARKSLTSSRTLLEYTWLGGKAILKSLDSS